jgi:succinate dehydrogenase / fumarate reductase iron-sulfur subunit
MAVKKDESFKITLSIQRGIDNPEMVDYEVEVDAGMVVLDAVHLVQAEHSSDLAVRWNCKAGKCGSCSAEINGLPQLMCMTKLSDYPELKKGGSIEIRPMRSFPLIKDIVTDVSWGFEANKRIKPFLPSTSEPLIMQQKDINRIQEFRKCIMCMACLNVCHVIRTHQMFDEYAGPMNLIKAATLEMHPHDVQKDRIKDVKNKGQGIGYCNINRCCTEVCPEDINITDNALIPLKERVVSKYYDPIAIIFNFLFRRNK